MMSTINNDVTGVAGSVGFSDQPHITADGKRKSKKRVRAFTSEDRASHRSIEKQRREALNQSFLVGFKTVLRDPFLPRLSLTSAGLIFTQSRISISTVILARCIYFLGTV